MEQDPNKFIDELIEFRKRYKERVEPEGVQLQQQDEKDLIKNEDFKKVIISTSLLKMLTEDINGSYWPLLQQLLDSVGNDVDKLVNLYEVTFNVGIDNLQHPMVGLKEAKGN
jgi:hypothetical protein